MNGIKAAIVGIAFLLGAIKVRNELAMTRMYERQAVALEALARAARTGGR